MVRSHRRAERLNFPSNLPRPSSRYRWYLSEIVESCTTLHPATVILLSALAPCARGLSSLSGSGGVADAAVRQQGRRQRSAPRCATAAPWHCWQWSGYLLT